MSFWSEGCQGTLKVLFKRDDSKDSQYQKGSDATTATVILPTKKRTDNRQRRDNRTGNPANKGELQLHLNQEGSAQLTFKFSQVQIVQFCVGEQKEEVCLVQLGRNTQKIPVGQYIFEVSYEQNHMDSNQVTFLVGVKRKDFTWRRYFFSNLFGLTPRTIVSLLRKKNDNLQFAEGFPLMFENTLNFEVPAFTVFGSVEEMRLLITDATGIMGQQELLKMANDLETESDKEKEEDERAAFGDHCCGRPYFWVRNLNDTKINSKTKSLCEINIAKVKEQDGKRTIPALLRKTPGRSNGLLIQTIIGIDFSSSNRSLLAPEGLHRDEAPATTDNIIGGKPGAEQSRPLNMYEGALKVIYDVMSQYDQSFDTPQNQGAPRLEMWGLCATKQGGMSEKENYFLMGAKNQDSPSDQQFSDPILNWEAMRQRYADEKRSVQFSGPTKIAPFLKKMRDRGKDNSGKREDPDAVNIADFRIVFILTDGMISDVTEIAQVVKETAKDEDCNMMFVFVQISKGGSASAQALKKLDKNKLTDLLVEEEGQELPDIVDCVEFKEEYLRYSKGFRTVFSEIPRTIVTLYGRRETLAKRRKEEARRQEASKR